MMTLSFEMFLVMLPTLIVAVSAMAVLMFGAFAGRLCSRGLVTFVSVAALGVAFCVLGQADVTRVNTLGGMVVHDALTVAVTMLLLAGGGVSLLLAQEYLKVEKLPHVEYAVLILTSILGMMLMVSSHNLLILYVGIEMQSLSGYVLSAMHRDRGHSAEAGMKYFVLGSMASGLFLFGVSLLYGFTGTLDYSGIGASFDAVPPMAALLGMVFVLAGLSFKMSVVPFHMWTPDVYEGSPTSVTAFFAVVPKLAAVAVIIRLLFEPFGAVLSQWQEIFWILCAGTMILASFAGLVQENINRLLAYSSIGNIGFVLLGIVAGTESGIATLFIYMFVYMVTAAGVFAVVLSMRREGRALDRIDDLAGLSRHSPAQAYAMAALMFSMAGIPPLAGFFAKVFILKAALDAGFFVLVVLGVLGSVVGAYYYLRIVKVMFFDPPVLAFDAPESPFFARAILGGSVLFILTFTLYLGPIVDVALKTAQAFLAGL